MPTGRGWVVAAAATLCCVGGWRLGYPELAVLGLGGALALAAALLRLARPVPLRTYREIAPIRVPRGDPALGVLSCTNLGRRSLDAVRAVDQCGPDEVHVGLPMLRPGGTHTITYVLPTRRRGHVPIGPLRLTATDPLGLVRRIRDCGSRQTLYVQPRTIALAALPSGRLASPEGPRSDRASGGTISFGSLRPYVFGDDLRHIHWRTTARANTLMVRQLVDTSLPRTVVLLDTRATAYATEDDFEMAVDVTASVAVSTCGLGFPVSVRCGSERLSSLDGRAGQAASLLDRLAVVGTRAAHGLYEALARARSPGPGRAALIVVTGCAATNDLPVVAAATGDFDRAVVVRVGTDPPVLPHALNLVVIDASDLERFALAWRRRAGP